MKSKRLKFTGSLGYKLSAILDLPDDGNASVFAIFAHCFTCNKNYKIFHSINQVLTHHKFGVLRFDFTGLGASQGSFGETNFSSNIGDIIAAVEFLELNYEAPELLIGHSLGGAAAIHAAERLSSCKAVVTIATPSNLASIRSLLMSKKDELERNGEANVSISGREFTIKKQFLSDVENVDMERALKNLKKPILICHSSLDELVPIEDAFQLFSLAQRKKSFIALDGADHLLSNSEDGKYLGQLIASWSQKHISHQS
ncbi:lysophospholipase [candidate division KSB1 bacterium]|nr:lysophospholipase [candidate division KSB1 bacterium]